MDPTRCPKGDRQRYTLVAWDNHAAQSSRLERDHLPRNIFVDHGTEQESCQRAGTVWSFYHRRLILRYGREGWKTLTLVDGWKQ